MGSPSCPSICLAQPPRPSRHTSSQLCPASPDACGPAAAPSHRLTAPPPSTRRAPSTGAHRLAAWLQAANFGRRLPSSLSFPPGDVVGRRNMECFCKLRRFDKLSQVSHTRCIHLSTDPAPARATPSQILLPILLLPWPFNSSVHPPQLRHGLYSCPNQETDANTLSCCRHGSSRAYGCETSTLSGSLLRGVGGLAVKLNSTYTVSS